MTADAKLDHLAEVVFVIFLQCKVLCLRLPFSMLYSLEGSHYGQPTLEEWGIMFYMLGKEYLYKSFHILTISFVYSPHLFAYSIIYISIDSWISILYFEL